MTNYFHPERESWFTIGRVPVNTTLFIVAINAIGTVLSAFLTGLPSAMFLDGQLVASGELWRLVTWPWVDRVSLWTAITWFVFWYFGTYLEIRLGRSKMLRFYLFLGLTLTVIYAAVGLVIPPAPLLGLSAAQFLVILIFIADNPRAPFFFGIPAWVLGVVFLSLEILQFVAARWWGGLLALVLSLVATVLVAQRFGLLTQTTWLPRLVPEANAGRSTSQPRGTSTTTRSRSGSGRGTSGRAKQESRVVSMSSAPSKRRSANSRATSDEDRMDELLDKISQGGLQSLSTKERDELERIRQRRLRN